MSRVLAIALGLGLSGFSLQAADNPKPESDPKGQAIPARKGWEKYDKNGDGKLDESEREAMKEVLAKDREARRKEFIAKYDKNKDGKLDEDELKAYREEQRQKALERVKQNPPKPEEKKGQ